MFIIDSSVESPDIDYLYNRVKDSMREGIALVELDDTYKAMLRNQNTIKHEIFEKYGIQNPNSQVQVVTFLENLNDSTVYEICHPEDKWITDKNVMARLALLGYEFAQDMLSYRKAKKFAESIKSFMDARLYTSGRVHPTVSLGKTNRLNMSEPPLLNIPKQLVWNMIKARKDGNYLYSVDIKNQEPCILINLLNIQSLKSALVDPRGLYEALFEKAFEIKAKANIYVLGPKSQEMELTDERLSMATDVAPEVYESIKAKIDSAYINGSRLLEVKTYNIASKLKDNTILDRLPNTVRAIVLDDLNREIEVTAAVSWEVDDLKESSKFNKSGIVEVSGTLTDLEIACVGRSRIEFKSSWNAMTYGASIYGVRAMCKNIDGDIVYKFFTKIPEFKDYKSKCNKLATAHKQEIDTYFGTRLRADEFYPARLKRVLMDLPIQGTASDILALLVEHLDSELEDRNLQDKIDLYFTRHDELILEVDKDWADSVGDEYVVGVLRDILEHRVDDWIPFKVEISRIKSEPIIVAVTDDDLEDAS